MLSRPGFFITGTDTDVGKTYVATCIALTLIQQGQQVIPRKPIASGCLRLADGSLLAEDALLLQQACQSAESLSDICRYQFEPAISPQTAIAQAGLSLAIQDLYQACQPSENALPTDLIMVEGAGGFYSPLALDGLNKDLAIALQLPVILVVGNRLGCINHTLLTLNAIEQAGLKTHAVIVNQLQHGQDFSQGLADFTDKPIFYTTYQIDKKPQCIADFSL